MGYKNLNKEEKKEYEDLRNWIDTADAPRKEGVRWSSELDEEDFKKKNQWKDEWMEKLEGKVKLQTKKPYIQTLLDLLRELLEEIEWEIGYECYVGADGDNISVGFKHFQNHYKKGMKIVFDPKYDFQAMIHLGLITENTVDKLENREAKEEKGVIVPGDKEVKEYG